MSQTLKEPTDQTKPGERGMIPRKILLIGWDAADWKVIRPMLEQGKMPVLKQLIDDGVSGNLATIRPILSPMLWTSIATGKRAWKHGIHGFSEPSPNGGGIRPITNLSRKSKAVWNIFNQQGWKSNVIGWWPSSPAEPINGVMISNHFQQAVADLDKPWPMRPGTVYPERLSTPLSEMRIHPAELENEHILPFIPKAAEIDQAKDKRMASCAKVIAEISSIHAAATACMQLEPWDFMAVYYDGIDHFGHGFMKYHPPRQSWVDENDFELYKDVIEAGYRYHDMMLETLLQLAGEDTTIMLVSDHGFEPGDLRPKSLPNEPAGPAAEHSPYGIFCLKGPGIKKGETVHGASLLDIAPTLLHLNGLPIGRDMDGKVMTNCFEEEQRIKYIDTWEEVEGEDGRHPANSDLGVAESRESIKQLVDLGYIDEPDEDLGRAIDETVRELRYNLAQAYIDGGLYADAAQVLEKLWERWPEVSRFGTKLLNCHLAQGDPQVSRQTLNLLKERKQKAIKLAKLELESFQKEIKEREAKRKVDGETNEATKEAGLLNRKEQGRLRRLKGQAGLNPEALAYFEGSVRLQEGFADKALESLKHAESTQSANKPSLYEKIGEAYLTLGDYDAAEESFLRVLSLNSNDTAARLGLARLYLEKKNYFQAAAEALAAIELIFHNPRAHTLYGTALIKLGKLQLAEKTLLTAVNQSQSYAPAQKQLVSLYSSGALKDDAKAAEHRKLAALAEETFQKRRYEVQFEGKGELVEFPAIRPQFGRLRPSDNDPLIVVSGLPRSGTSLMMQMLDAAGISLRSDGVRAADRSNPKGYYEDERIKKLASKDERRWLFEARGEAIKIVAPFVTFLPNDLPAKIVFMVRDVDEVMASQRTMLHNDGKLGASSSDSELSRVYAGYLNRFNQWAEVCKSVEVLPILYAKAI
ncbi:MAG: alkaline phosphatase family protein, partial [Verrucomicrobiota bacterium]